MWRTLFKTVPVNLKRDLGTYVLMGILVAVGMFIASAFAGITYSYDRGCEENYRVSNAEDGQFQVTEPLSSQEEESITQKDIRWSGRFTLIPSRRMGPSCVS